MARPEGGADRSVRGCTRGSATTENEARRSLWALRRSSAADQPDDEGQDEREQQRRRDRKIERPVAALDVDIARQSTDARNPPDDQQDHAEHDDQTAEHDQELAEIGHGFRRRVRHSNSFPCPGIGVVPGGGSFSRCAYASSVTRRPRVPARTMNPIFRRYGSTISASVSASSLIVAAMASIPAGPPP